MRYTQKYTYMHAGHVYLIVPVIAGESISTDNTCKTFFKLNDFLQNAEFELLALQEKLARNEIVDIKPEAASDIENYLELFKELKSNIGEAGGPGFKSAETDKLMNSGLHAVVFNSSYNRDRWLKSNKQVFAVNHDKSVFADKMREFFKYASPRNTQLNQSFSEYFNKVKSLQIKTDISSDLDVHKKNLLSVLELAWSECGLPLDVWQTVALELCDDRIASMQLLDLFDLSTTASYISSVLETNWSIILEDFIGNISWFNSYADEPLVVSYWDQTKYNKLAVLTQFFLAITNIYLFEKGFRTNLGGYFEKNNSARLRFIELIVEKVRNGANVEDAILDYLESNFSEINFTDIDRAAIKNGFVNKYRVIENSENFDEYFILPSNTDSNWFSYAGAISCEFSHFALQCLKSRPFTYVETTNKHKGFLKRKRVCFSQVARQQDNSLAVTKIKTTLFCLGDESSLEHYLEKIIASIIAPNENIFPQYLDLSSLDEIEIKSMITCGKTDELTAEIKSYLENKYYLNFIAESSVDKENLSSYPDSIQIQYLQNDPSLIYKLDKSKLSINLAKLGYDLKYLCKSGFSLRDLKNRGFTMLNFASSRISLWDLYLNTYSHLSLVDYVQTIFEPGNAMRFQAMKVVTFLSKSEHKSLKELKDQGFELNILKALNFTAEQLKDAGYSVFHIIQAGYNKDDLIAAGFEHNVVVNVFFFYDPNNSASNANAIIIALKNREHSFHDLRNAGFTAKELREALDLSACDLYKSGYRSSDLKDAGFSTIEIKYAKLSLSFKSARAWLLGDDPLQVDALDINLERVPPGVPAIAMQSLLGPSEKGSDNIQANYL